MKAYAEKKSPLFPSGHIWIQADDLRSYSISTYHAGLLIKSLKKAIMKSKMRY